MSNNTVSFDIFQKTAFLGKLLVSGLKSGLNFAVKNPGRVIFTALPLSMAGTAIKTNMDNRVNQLYKGTTMPYHRFKISSYDGNTKVDIDITEEDYSNELLSYGPHNAVKIAMLCFSEEPHKLVKIARVDLDSAFEVARKNYDAGYNVLVENGYGSNFKIASDEIPEDTKKIVNSLDEFKNADINRIKLADRVLHAALPTLYTNKTARAIWLAYASFPNTDNVKTAYFASPSTGSWGKYVLPAIGVGGAALLANHLLDGSASGGSSRLSPLSSAALDRIYGQILMVEPSLADYEPSRVRMAIKELKEIAPNVMKHPMVASHFVKQLLDAPSGGLSADFIKSLTTAEEKYTSSKEFKALNPVAQGIKIVQGLGQMFF